MQLYWANTEGRMIHKDPSNEACNRDDTKRRIRIGTKDVHMMLRGRGSWHLCSRCFTDEEGAELRQAAGAVEA